MKSKCLLHRQFFEFWMMAAALMGGAGALAQPDGSTDWRYTIRPQDTVSELTRQYLKPSISWQALANYNQLPDAHVIQTGAQLRIPLRWLSAKQAQVKLVALSGDVSIQGTDGAWHPARQGETMQTGQRIQVGRNSSARLQFADASELVMQPESSVTMDALSVYGAGFMADTKLRLQAGRVEVHANPQGRQGQKFDVITPAAVASVRGTQFVVEAQADRSLEQTFQGKVALETRQGSVVVEQGYGSAVKAGEMPRSPEAIRPAPVLQTATTRFEDFPIAFAWADQPDASGWVMQVGRDQSMAQLVLNQKSATPQMDLGGVEDGAYYLRAWSLDAQGMPSMPGLHRFDVNIPRKLQGAAIHLLPRYFAAGAMQLDLKPLESGQRYLVQVTQDAAGRLPVWHAANAGASITVPEPPAQDGPSYLWIWVY